MKILVVSNMFPDKDNPSYGIFVKRFCDQLPKIGVDFRLAVMTKGKNRLDKIAKYMLFYIFSFIECLFGKYDVIYVHYASHSSAGVLLARKIRKFRIYANLHGSDVVPENKSQEKMQLFTRGLLSRSSRVIVPSEYFKSLVADKYSFDKKKIYVYPSAGIDKRVFHEIDGKDTLELKQKLKIKPETYTFGMLGRISYKKGWDTFLEATKIVFDNGYQPNFIVIGDGQEVSLLEAKMENLDIKSKIIYIKKLIPQTELAKYYSMMDWFVFPTERAGESLGLVAIEAMACGTPVITSDYAAPKYYINNGVNGYKFEMGNAKALAELIIRIIDENKSKSQYRLGVEATAREYCEEKIIKTLKNILTLENNDD